MRILLFFLVIVAQQSTLVVKIGKTESIADLKEHIEFLEQKIETLENQKKQLEADLEEKEDELVETNQRLDDDEETMQRQLTRIQELEQELADAKKSKACVIL